MAWVSSRVPFGCCLRASQCSLHNAPIFRLLLKVAVNGTHQCESHNFWWSFCSNLDGVADSLPLSRTRSSERMGSRWLTQKHSLRCLLEPANPKKPSLGNKHAGNWRGCSVVVQCPAGLWIGSVARKKKEKEKGCSCEVGDSREVSLLFSEHSSPASPHCKWHPVLLALLPA